MVSLPKKRSKKEIMEKKNNLQMYLHPAATHGHGGSSTLANTKSIQIVPPRDSNWESRVGGL